MSVESTRETVSAYLKALLDFGNYTDYMAEDVLVTVMGTDQEVKGRQAAKQMIDFLHQQAFETRVNLRSAVFGDGQAMAEAEFIGKHIGEFAGTKATGKEVKVPYSAAYDLEDGKIKALRLYFPMDVLLRQIGGGSQ